MGSTLWERKSDIFRRERDSILERMKKFKKDNFKITHDSQQNTAFYFPFIFLEAFIVLIQLQNANIWGLGSWFERDYTCCFV